jgi:hypothetical protein
MPAFAGGYSDAEIAALSNFVFGYFGNQPGTLTAKDIARPESVHRRCAGHGSSQNAARVAPKTETDRPYW